MRVRGEGEGEEEGESALGYGGGEGVGMGRWGVKGVGGGVDCLRGGPGSGSGIGSMGSVSVSGTGRFAKVRVGRGRKEGEGRWEGLCVSPASHVVLWPSAAADPDTSWTRRCLSPAAPAHSTTPEPPVEL